MIHCCLVCYEERIYVCEKVWQFEGFKVLTIVLFPVIVGQ